MNHNLELLSSVLRSVGAGVDVPTLELILAVNELIAEKGANVSFGEVGDLSNAIASKYQLNK